MRFIDLLCGAGGSSTGLVEAGGELLLGINHWQLALDTHAANHPTGEHLKMDLSESPMRWLPRAQLLWASVICTEASPAGGNRAETLQGDLFENDEEFQPLPKEAFERTRATAWSVIRAAEAKRFASIVVENVVEFATRWPLFRTWLAGMKVLGYEYQIISVSSAHVGDEDNLRAPQWRDRIYIVFTLKGMRKPDLRLRPLAWCVPCGREVRGKQSWRNPRVRIGKYGQQYDYRCPNSRCRHAIVEPYVRPASDAIDWTDLGRVIGQRKKPLVPATMARIRAGVAKFPMQPSAITVNHGKEGGDRAFAVHERPLPTRATKEGEALIVPVGGTWRTEATSAGEPLPTRTTSETDALVTGPMDPFIVEYRHHSTTSGVDTPLSTMMAGGRHHGLVTDPRQKIAAAGNRHSLVIPYRNAAARPVNQPLHTLSTRDSAALLHREAPAIEDCRFRMLKPREQALAQRLPPLYILLGTQAEQTAMTGNAVSVNVAHWIGKQLMAVL